MAHERVWIMDGHNMIFAIPDLQRLQVTDRREEARAELTDRLERFATARGEKVLVVFDGNRMRADPDAIRRPLFEVAYTRRGEGAADERIIRAARDLFERGVVVTVVTNDVSTLARNLPRGVRHLGVEEFWLRHIEKHAAMDGAAGEKRVVGDFSDIEREMLLQAAGEERAFRRHPARPWDRTGHGGMAPTRPGTLSGAVGEADRIARKRERGRIRQERRLSRRAAPRRRR